MTFSQYFANSIKSEKTDFSNFFQSVLTAKAAGMPIDPSVHRMLQCASSDVQNGKTKIAVIGGSVASRGRLLAAWAEQPLTDFGELDAEGNFYSYEMGDYCITGEFCKIINSASQGQDIDNATRIRPDIFVSDAHFLLYLVSANNPMQILQDENLVWLFRTLNLLPRTIFVLDGFDEVADVEDDSEYQNFLEIKRNDLMQGLSERIKLDNEEVENLSVVAVASDPYGKGMDYWVKNIPKYQRLSKISQLRVKVDAVKGAFPKNSLRYSQQSCLVRHILDMQLAFLVNSEKAISVELSILSTVLERFKNRLSVLAGQMDAAGITLLNFSDLYFSDLVMQVQSCGQEDFNEFFEREIGSNTLKISSVLKKEIDRQVSLVGFEAGFLLADLDVEIERFEFFGSLIQEDSEFDSIKSNLSVLKNSITSNQIDFLKIIFDQSVDGFLKSEAGATTGYIKSISSFVPVVGVAVDVWEKWGQNKKEADFREKITELASCIKKQQAGIVDFFEQGVFKELFFKHHLQLVDDVEKLSALLESGRIRLRNTKKWRAKMELASVNAFS